MSNTRKYSIFEEQSSPKPENPCYLLKRMNDVNIQEMTPLVTLGSTNTEMTNLIKDKTDELMKLYINQEDEMAKLKEDIENKQGLLDMNLPILDVQCRMHEEYKQQSEEDIRVSCEEIQRLTILNGITCIMCCTKKIEISFRPCRHAICCRVCARQCTSCPLCRGAIRRIHRVFLP